MVLVRAARPAASLLVLLVSLLLVQFAAEASEDSPQPMNVRPQRGLFVAVSSVWLALWGGVTLRRRHFSMIKN